MDRGHGISRLEDDFNHAVAVVDAAQVAVERKLVNLQALMVKGRVRTRIGVRVRVRVKDKVKVKVGVMIRVRVRVRCFVVIRGRKGVLCVRQPCGTRG